MATPIDPRRRAAIDALMTAGWAEATDVAGRIADVVIAAVDKVGWNAHVDSALSVFKDATDADVVTLYDESDRPYGRVHGPHDDNPENYPWTVSGEFNRLLRERVTYETCERLVTETGEDSANYIIESILRSNGGGGRWQHVRFDSESGNFFAYTQTKEQAEELLDYIIGLTWAAPKEEGS